MARLTLGDYTGDEAAMYTYPLDPSIPAPQAMVTPIGQLVPYSSPVVPQTIMPAPTTMAMPGMVTTAQLTNPNPQPNLTPGDLLKPLPTIVNNQPTNIAQCDSFAQWVDQNPMLAGGALLLLAWFTFGRKG